jgi:hypothetical protein
MRCVVVPALAAGLICGGSAMPVRAGGLDILHSKVPVGHMMCFTDHWHRGGGRPMPTREAALADAARSWTSLVVLEYGASWGDFRSSHAQQIQCTPAAIRNGGHGWMCQVASLPCRPR